MARSLVVDKCSGINVLGDFCGEVKMGESCCRYIYQLLFIFGIKYRHAGGVGSGGLGAGGCDWDAGEGGEVVFEDLYSAGRVPNQRSDAGIRTLLSGCGIRKSRRRFWEACERQFGLEAGEALGRVGSVAGVEGFHAPGGHGKCHDEIGVGDLGVVCIRVDLYRAVACLAAGFVT